MKRFIPALASVLVFLTMAAAFAQQGGTSPSAMTGERRSRRRHQSKLLLLANGAGPEETTRGKRGATGAPAGLRLRPGFEPSLWATAALLRKAIPARRLGRSR